MYDKNMNKMLLRKLDILREEKKMDRKHKVSPKLIEYDEFNNLKEMIYNSREKFGEFPAFKFKTEIPGKFRTENYKDFVDKIDALGTALISVGLKDKRIAVIGENRYEWALSYLSIVCGAGIVVPLDKSLPENELLSLVERSDVEAIFYSEKGLEQALDKISGYKGKNIGIYDYFGLKDTVLGLSNSGNDYSSIYHNMNGIIFHYY